jgi:hypothetical protein
MVVNFSLQFPPDKHVKFLIGSALIPFFPETKGKKVLTSQRVVRAEILIGFRFEEVECSCIARAGHLHLAVLLRMRAIQRSHPHPARR